MKITYQLAVWSTAAVISSSACLAEDTNSTSAAAQPSASQQQASSPLQQANAQEFFRASDLIGKNTQDSKGTKVGEIKEIAFNQQGEIFAFVDIGSGKWAAVPWPAINSASAKGKGNVTLNATQQQLKAGPAVTKDQWGSVNNPSFAQGCYTYYNVQAPNATGAASSPGGTTQGQGQSQPQSQSSTTNSATPPQQ